jgi:methionyl-tRNA formyltransferase
MNGKKAHLNGKSLRIVFFGTSAFGLPSLQMLSENYDILQVFTNNPKPAGRGKGLKKTSIHEFAETLDLKIHTTEKPMTQDLLEEFDVGIVIAYGSIISKAVLEKAKFGFLNLHPSNLPIFRGAAPIERTLEAGFTETKICIIKMTPKLDDGDIVVSENYSILLEDNSITLHSKFAEIGAKILPLAIQKIVSCDDENFIKQNDALATYAKKITKEELFCNSVTDLNSTEVLNKIRAFASYGYVFILHKEVRIKILQAIISEKRLTDLDVKTSDGFISPVLIKPEGKKEMLINDYLNQFK